MVDDPLTRAIIGAAIEVHGLLGPGFLESIYETCLADELERRGLCFVRQMALDIEYKGKRLDGGLRIDLLIEDRVVVEVKAVDALYAVHEAQLLSYMRLAPKPVGLLINFNVPVLHDGVKRRILSELLPKGQ